MRWPTRSNTASAVHRRRPGGGHLPRPDRGVSVPGTTGLHRCRPDPRSPLPLFRSERQVGRVIQLPGPDDLQWWRRVTAPCARDPPEPLRHLTAPGPPPTKKTSNTPSSRRGTMGDGHEAEHHPDPVPEDRVRLRCECGRAPRQPHTVGLGRRGLDPAAPARERDRGVQQQSRLIGGFGSCPSWARTRTLLIQSQTCCQLHQGAVN